MAVGMLLWPLVVAIIATGILTFVTAIFPTFITTLGLAVIATIITAFRLTILRAVITPILAQCVTVAFLLMQLMFFTLAVGCSLTDLLAFLLRVCAVAVAFILTQGLTVLIDTLIILLDGGAILMNVLRILLGRLPIRWAVQRSARRWAIEYT